MDDVLTPREIYSLRDGAEAYGAGRPISDAPRTSNSADAKRWREGWLRARKAEAESWPTSFDQRRDGEGR